jgi:hypothetical protein
MEFDLGEADLTEIVKEARKVRHSFFAHGVKLDSVEKLRASPRKGGCREVESATGSGGQGGETKEVAASWHDLQDSRQS